jgi:hypothetical protein
MVEFVSMVPMPEEVRHLLMLAGEWGIGDDIFRSEKVDTSPADELRSLVEKVNSTGDMAYQWLADASGENFSDPDYVAISCIVLAAEEARVTLEMREEIIL